MGLLFLQNYPNLSHMTTKKPRNKAISLHPLTVGQIASAMLATPPMKKKKPVKRA
jgi:hypothetical protein